jgi:hypothetical protein
VFLSVLAAVGIVAIRWRELTLSPDTRFSDFAEQIAPVIEEYNAVSQAIPTIDDLKDDSEHPVRGSPLSDTLRALRGRATANARRLARAVTPDPDLQELRGVLATGISAQLSTLGASLVYLNTRDPKSLSRPEGVSANWSSIIRSSREFEERRRAYLRSHGLGEPGDAAAEDVRNER